MAEIDRWQAKRCSLTVFSVRFDMPLQLVGVPALAGSDRDKVLFDPNTTNILLAVSLLNLLIVCFYATYQQRHRHMNVIFKLI